MVVLRLWSELSSIFAFWVVSVALFVLFYLIQPIYHYLSISSTGNDGSGSRNPSKRIVDHFLGALKLWVMDLKSQTRCHEKENLCLVNWRLKTSDLPIRWSNFQFSSFDGV